MKRHRGNLIILPYIFIFLFLAGLRLGSAVVGTTITPSQSITDPETIISSRDGIFRLGFFSLGDSQKRYVGIWYNNIPGPTIVWVANRDHPLNDSTGVFKIASDGNLVVLDGQGRLCWTSNVTDIGSDQLVAELLDNGNLVLRESQSYNYNEGRYLWQSFDHPTDTFLPNMQFGVNLRTGEKQTITSWKNDSDPSTGEFTLELDPYVIPQLIIKNGVQKKWRIGPGVDQDRLSSHFTLQRDYLKGTVFLCLYDERSALSRIVLDSDGKLVEKQWHEETKKWRINWSPDIYNNCGPFGIYNQHSQACSCMRGFDPKFRNEWDDGNWSGGCSRRKDLQCEMLRNKTADQNSSDRTMVREADGFLKVASNVPDYFHWLPGISHEQCHDKCLHNCACTAYLHSSDHSGYAYTRYSYESSAYTRYSYDSYAYTRYYPDIGCMWWTRDLMDTRQASDGLSFNIFIRVANSELG
ncbi:hypothetical protein MKX03_030986 [Papaver bracteatum]|nr:hypothetical protein MKX03_030986 [Papaver bracteatum]